MASELCLCTSCPLLLLALSHWRPVHTINHAYYKTGYDEPPFVEWPEGPGVGNMTGWMAPMLASICAMEALECELLPLPNLAAMVPAVVNVSRRRGYVLASMLVHWCRRPTVLAAAGLAASHVAHCLPQLYRALLTLLHTHSQSHPNVHSWCTLCGKLLAAVRGHVYSSPLMMHVLASAPQNLLLNSSAITPQAILVLCWRCAVCSCTDGRYPQCCRRLVRLAQGLLA